MLALLSPAKKLDDRPVALDLAPTQPALMGDTLELMQTTRTLGVDDLKSLMHLSDKLATLNHERFQAWQETHDPDNALPAALTFAGDVYQGLDARSLSEDDLAWAQDHVAILSGLYGVLRPLDLIQPYRLEMGTRLPTDRGGSLYDFWGATLAPILEERLADHREKVFVNLASNEYFGAVDVKRPDHPVLDVRFVDRKDGKSRVISFYAKRARGALARWMVEQRADRVEALKDAVIDDYRFDPEESTEWSWTFGRKQPPPKGR